MIHQTIERALQGVAIALGFLLMQAPAALAHHTLRKEITDLFGPTAWGIYVIVPVPFLVIGTIAFLLYRAARTERNAPEEGRPHSRKVGLTSKREGT